MLPEHTGMIAQTIQLALAPVFVLVAIGNIMNILTTRLGRMVDRSRHLQMLHAGTKGTEHDAVVIEMRHIDKRIAHIGRALLLLVLSGLAIGTTVGSLFVSEMGGTELRLLTASTFFRCDNAPDGCAGACSCSKRASPRAPCACRPRCWSLSAGDL